VLLRLRQPARRCRPERHDRRVFEPVHALGCLVAYRPERNLLICPATGAASIHRRPPDRHRSGEPSLPRSLRVAAPMVQAIGVTGLIYGRETNIL
jgi:hypothetical protein